MALIVLERLLPKQVNTLYFDSFILSLFTFLSVAFPHYSVKIIISTAIEAIEKKIAIYFIHFASLTYPCSLKLFALKPFDKANIIVIASTAKLKCPIIMHTMAAILNTATKIEDIHFIFMLFSS